MFFVCISVSGEDLVSEQACQREENEQEEAAAFPAGLHHYTHLTCARWVRWRPRRHQPQRQHFVWHDIRRILGGFHTEDWYSVKCVHSVFCFRMNEDDSHPHAVMMLHLLFFFFSTMTKTLCLMQWSPPPGLCQSQDFNVLIWIIISTKILILNSFAVFKNCW